MAGYSNTRATIDDGTAAAGSADTARSRAWWVVAGLLITAFLARGPLYLSVFPPFEGWDEYQHLAYIVHLDAMRAIPVLDERTRVSLALRPLMIATPHSASEREQVKEWGVRSYADFWSTPAPGPADANPAAFSSPRLYQAQHPPLSYVLALPIWRALRRTHPLEAIYAIRTMNLLFVAAALVLFAGCLPRVVPAFAPRTAVFALVCLHPLFFQNVARVANDGLAVATGIAGMSLLILADGPTLLARGLLAAVLVAASVWSKQTGLTLIPALVLGVPFIGWIHGVSTRRLWQATSMAPIALLVLVAPLWLWSYRHYGSIVTTQESVGLAARGSIAHTLATSFVNLDWKPLIETLFVPGTPWVGGWSFLPMNETLTDVHKWYWSILLIAAAAGAVVAIVRRIRSIGGTVRIASADAPVIGGLFVCATVVAFTILGLLHHAVVSNAVYGRTTTNPWYFMAALPFLFVLLVRALEALDSRVATAAGAALAVLFVVIDLHGTWIDMPAGYAGTTDVALQWSRLTAIHPALLSGDFRWLFLATQLGALCLVVVGFAYAMRQAPDGERSVVNGAQLSGR